MNLFGKELFEVFTGFHPYFFNGGALMPDNDSFLGIALHHDHRPDSNDVLIFKKLLGLHVADARGAAALVRHAPAGGSAEGGGRERVNGVVGSRKGGEGCSTGVPLSGSGGEQCFS